MLVVLHFETMIANDTHLQVLQLWAVELNDSSTIQTDQMIMMRHVYVIFCIAIGKLAFHGNACLNQKLQRPENGGRINLPPFLPQMIVQFIDSVVPVQFQKFANNEFSLRR